MSNNGWLAKQLGFDNGTTVPVPLPDVHNTPVGYYALPPGAMGRHGMDHHGHSHDGGGCGGGNEMANMEANLPLEAACGFGDFARVVLLWAQGIEIQGRKVLFNGVEATPLMWAALKGHLPIVKFLADKGASIVDATPDGQNALMWAANEGRYDVVEFLLSRGANPHAVDSRGYNSYFVAVQSTNLAMLALLVQHSPVDGNVRDGEGHTLLHWAAYRGSLAIAQYLHEVLNLSVEAMDSLKRTPLIWAAREGHDAVCAYLLSRGAKSLTADCDNLNALQHAAERNQRAVTVVLQANITDVSVRRRLGTLTLVATDRFALMSALVGVGYVVVAFVAMLFFPSVFSHFAFGLYYGKNLVTTLVYKFPANHRSKSGTDFAAVAESSGIPRNFKESIQSPDHLIRGREPANLFAFLAFLAVQLMSLQTAQLEQTPVYWILMSLSMIFLFMTKHVSMRHQVVPSGSIHDSATIRAVKEKKFKLIQVRVIDQEKHIRIPLRAFYCHEIDEIVKCYDSYSALADAPIGEANLHWFFLFVLSFSLLQAHVFSSSWDVLSERLSCGLPSAYSGTAWGFLFHALPCGLKPIDETWVSFLMPQPLNASGIWIIHFALATAVMGAVTFYRLVSTIARGVTRREMNNPTAPTMDGDLVTIFPNGAASSIFSEGGFFSNVLALLVGRFGMRWRGLYAVPAPPA